MSISASSDDDRGQWGSKLGFIMAAAGSAVGLGNIWRFPYVTGENGGAAFVVVYLACVLFIGLPLMWCELALGRASGRNPVGAFRETGGGLPFLFTGVLCLAACFFVLTYYGVIAGWTISYAISQISQTQLIFKEYVADPVYVLPVFALFIVLTVVIVRAGVEKGIEKWSKILMPILFALMLVVIVRGVTLDGAGAGLTYYLKPDFGKIDGIVVLKALGQAFFSLSVGWGLMITYGSYMSKKEDIISNVDEILLDDLNTPGYIARIHELYNAASKGDKEKKIMFNQACKLLGLFNVSKTDWESLKKNKISVSEDYIKNKITERTNAKNKGDFSLADEIRKELLSKGILIEDHKGKTIWKIR